MLVAVVRVLRFGRSSSPALACHPFVYGVKLVNGVPAHR